MFWPRFYKGIGNALIWIKYISGCKQNINKKIMFENRFLYMTSKLTYFIFSKHVAYKRAPSLTFHQTKMYSITATILFLYNLLHHRRLLPHGLLLTHLARPQ